MVRIIALLLIPITHSTFSTSTSSFCFPIFISFISICILLLLSLLFLLSLIAFDFDLCCFEYWLSLFCHQNENKGYAQRKKCVEIMNDMYIHPYIRRMVSGFITALGTLTQVHFVFLHLPYLGVLLKFLSAYKIYRVSVPVLDVFQSSALAEITVIHASTIMFT